MAFFRAFAAEPPRLVERGSRYALLVDGKPFIILGGQVLIRARRNVTLKLIESPAN
ncbi:MAG: hypothetical protein WCC27_17175 [Acidobacteriaceae bacterium]